MEEILQNQLKNTLNQTNFSLGNFYKGKVRDNYILDDLRIIISTDRLSSFDRVITTIPSKGQILNQLSAFWFEKVKNIAKTHFVEMPDPNVSIVKQCDTIPIEIIIRAYITGTSWRNHKKGIETSGISFPSNIKENQKLDDLVVTPSTKAENGHDIYLSKQQILDQQIIDKETYDQMVEISLRLFEYGFSFSKNNGLILVDTKYEFGIKDGELLVIDEIHTPDSSRFWIEETYEKNFLKGETPENLDKEIFRSWLMTKYPKIFPDIKPKQKVPEIPDNIRIELSKKYIRNYQKITGLIFKPEMEFINIEDRIKRNLMNANYL